MSERVSETLLHPPFFDQDLLGSLLHLHPSEPLYSLLHPPFSPTSSSSSSVRATSALVFFGREWEIYANDLPPPPPFRGGRAQCFPTQCTRTTRRYLFCFSSFFTVHLRAKLSDFEPWSSTRRKRSSSSPSPPPPPPPSHPPPPPPTQDQILASKFDKLRLNGWEQQQQQQQQRLLVNGAKMKDNGHRQPPPPPPGHRQQQQQQQQPQREDEAIQRRRRQQQEEEEEQRGRRARGGRDEADRAVPQEDLDQGDEILRYKKQN